LEINKLLKFCCFFILAQILLIDNSAAQALIFKDSFENCLPGATLIWDGGGDNVLWADPANWQGNLTPANGDSVSIQIPGQQAIVFDSSLGSREIRCLSSERALSITGGNLEILQSGVINSSVTVTGGSLEVTGRLSADTR